MPLMPKRKATPRPPSSRLARLKRQRTAHLTRVAARAAMLQRRGRQDEAYTLICNEFVALGGIYVKFLQGVLLNSPIMKRWHNPDRLKIFEGLDPEAIDIISLLQTHLSPEKLSQIAKLQTVPFASGSFGQVYYGELQNGQQIIVKALRPQVRELLQHDLRMIGLFTKFFGSRHYKNVDLNLNDAIKDFRRATLAETDYVQEAKFADEMYAMQKHHPDVVIPRTYMELCTPQFIVQDYIGGLSCATLLKLYTEAGMDPETYVKAQLGSDLKTQLEKLGIALLDSVFEQPRIMGDPHPGNIHLLPDNKVGMIDFGIAANAPVNRPAFYGLIREWSHMYHGTLQIPRLFEQFLRVFVNDLYRAFKKLTRLLPQEASANASQDVMKNVGGIVNELFDDAQDEETDETMSQGRLLKLFSQVINKGNRLGLNIKLNDSDLLRAAQTYMSLVESLGLRAEVLSVVFDTVVREQGSKHRDLLGDNEKAMTTSQALEVISAWLERVAAKDPMLFRRMLQQIGDVGTGTAKAAKEAVESITETVSETVEKVNEPPVKEQHA